MPLADAEKLVVRVRESVMRTTLARVSELCDELLPRYAIVAMTLRHPPLDFVPVTVAEAHRSYPVMCRADGMMYHDALSAAARRLTLSLELGERGEEAMRAADRLGVSLEEVERFLQIAGGTLGPPWQKEHRLAAAAAMGVLAAHVRISVPA
jgi:hypothetical protein